MASAVSTRPTSPTPSSLARTPVPKQTDLEPVLANVPTPAAFTRPSSSPPTSTSDPQLPPGYIPRRRSAIIVTSSGPCSFTPRRRNALVPLPLLPPPPPDTIVTSVKILHNDGSNGNSTYSFGSHCHPANGRQNYGPEITCGSITFTNSFACNPPPRRRRSSLNPVACAAAAAKLAAIAHAQDQAQIPTAAPEAGEDVTMSDASEPAAKAAADGNDQLVTVVSSPILTKTTNRNGDDKQPDSPTQTSFFFSPLARPRNQRRRTSCTPCNVPAPIQTTKAAPAKPSPAPTAPLPPTPTTPVQTTQTVPSTPMPPSMPSMPSTPMPTSPRPSSPSVPATPNNSIDGHPPKPRSTIVVTVRKSPSAARHDAFAPPASPWPRDSPFPWSNSGNPKPVAGLDFPRKETTASTSPVAEAVANVMAMEVDPVPIIAEPDVQRVKAHRSVPAMHNPISLAGIRLMNERSRRFNMPHPPAGISPLPTIRRSGPAAPMVPSKPLWNRPRVSSRLVTRPFMTPESLDGASHTVLLGDTRVTAQLSPQFSADQLYISQRTLHPRLPGRTVSSARLLSASRTSSDSDSIPTFGLGFSGSTYVARASGIRSVAGKPMRASNKAATKNGGVPMLRTAVINNSGPDVGRRILAMGVHLAHEIYEAEEDLARQEQAKAKGEDKMAMDLDAEESAPQSLPPPPRRRAPRSKSQARAQAQSQSASMEKDTEMDVEKILEHYITDGDVEMEDAQTERVDLNLKKEETPTSTSLTNEENRLSQTTITAPTTTKTAAIAAEDDAKENKPTQIVAGIKTMATIHDSHNAKDQRFSFEMV